MLAERLVAGSPARQFVEPLAKAGVQPKGRTFRKGRFRDNGGAGQDPLQGRVETSTLGRTGRGRVREESNDGFERVFPTGIWHWNSLLAAIDRSAFSPLAEGT